MGTKDHQQNLFWLEPMAIGNRERGCHGEIDVPINICDKNYATIIISLREEYVAYLYHRCSSWTWEVTLPHHMEELVSVLEHQVLDHSAVANAHSVSKHDVVSSDGPIRSGRSLPHNGLTE